MPQAPDRWPSEWLRGVLQLCILGAMTQGPSHGYALAQQIEAAGLGQVKGGTLYPLLSRLEAEGLVVATWRAGDGGPGRKVFDLTTAGRREAVSRGEAWSEFVGRARTLLPPLTQPDTQPDTRSVIQEMP